jgi:hypothetical protein
VVNLLLLDGISGFRNNEVPDVYASQFKELCYSLANITHGKLVSFEIPDQSRNFYKAELEWNKGNTFILLNSSYPVLAFASSVEHFNIHFVDHPHAKTLKTFSTVFTIATFNELIEPLEIDERTKTVLNKNTLNQSEINQILYWKPKIVGDVVFNFWN